MDLYKQRQWSPSHHNKEWSEIMFEYSAASDFSRRKIKIIRHNKWIESEQKLWIRSDITWWERWN